MQNVCSPSVDAETMQHRKGPAAGIFRERCRPSHKPNKLVPTKKTSTNERENMNSCYVYANAEGFCALLSFFLLLVRSSLTSLETNRSHFILCFHGILVFLCAVLYLNLDAKTYT